MSPPARQTPSLRELRLRIGVPGGWSTHRPPTIAEVAAQAGVTHPHISGIELGKHRGSYQLLWELARIYGVHPEVVHAAQEETQRRADAGEPQVRTVRPHAD